MPLYDSCDAKCKLARHSGSEYSRELGTVPRTSIDQRRDEGGCRRRRRDFGIRWVRDVHFSFSSVALHPPPRTRMTRRIVLFERENTTTRKLLLTRSRATIRVFAGSSISFYLVTLSLRRRVEVRVTGRDGEGGREDERLRRGATRDASQKFPRGKLFASNNFKGGTSFLRNDCTKLRRLRWK